MISDATVSTVIAGTAKQSSHPAETWIASSLTLLAWTD
jgi:hypothetical protein